MDDDEAVGEPGFRDAVGEQGTRDLGSEVAAHGTMGAGGKPPVAGLLLFTKTKKITKTKCRKSPLLTEIKIEMRLKMLTN